jgi:hypothetical protein
MDFVELQINENEKKYIHLLCFLLLLLSTLTHELLVGKVVLVILFVGYFITLSAV